MTKNEVPQSASTEPVEVIDLGNATEKTLGTTRAGVHEPLGPRRYRT